METVGSIVFKAAGFGMWVAIGIALVGSFIGYRYPKAFFYSCFFATAVLLLLGLLIWLPSAIRLGAPAGYEYLTWIASAMLIPILVAWLLFGTLGVISSVVRRRYFDRIRIDPPSQT